VEKNQELLRHFFYSTRNFLHPIQGEVLVSLRNTLFYNRWNIQEQAKRSGFKLKRTEKFDSSLYAGYEPQRTHPASFRGEPPTTSNAFTHIFVLDKTLTPEIPLTQGRANHANKLAQSKASSKKSNSSNKISSSVLQCKVCQVTLKDQKKYNAHINSAKHARKIKAAKKNQSIK
jgi:25S rRNA (uracil2634-N3)-methyltransferase